MTLSEPTATKACSKCERYLPSSEFHRSSKHSSGLRSWCKQCCSSYYKNRRKTIARTPAIRDQQLEKQRERNVRRRMDPATRAADNAKAAERQRKLRQISPAFRDKANARTAARQCERNYGIPITRKRSAISLLSGKCQLCREQSHRLVIDHDHCLSGPESIRGFLCDKCNTAIGQLGDTATSLEKAVIYIKSKPGQKLLQIVAATEKHQ